MRGLAKNLIIVLVLTLAYCGMLSAQSNQFSYQGSLNTAGTPANGNYDFEFVLFDALNGGSQVGSILVRNNVVVANGVFAVQLDFGASFPGAGRFLEIRVRPTGQPGITTLAPRQAINSSPYSIKSLTADNANTVGGQTAVSVANTVITVNSATQANIPNTLVMRNASGDFSGNTITASQQYNIGADRVLSTSGFNNFFVGVNAGLSNTTGSFNSFFGLNAGRDNTEGAFNAFFGRDSGRFNTTGGGNSFFGNSSGRANTMGSSNSFFGNSSGQNNTLGVSNAFFGASAGRANTFGSDNSFFGSSAGDLSLGSSNSFFGSLAGVSNTSGSSNSFFGRSSGSLNSIGNFNSFFGFFSGLTNSTGISNSFFGSSTGRSNTEGINNAFFGAGAGSDNTTGNLNAFFGSAAGDSNTTGDNNTIVGYRADVGSVNLTYATAIGSDAVVSTSNTVVLGRAADIVRIPGFLRVVQLGSPGSISLCSNVNDTISTCSSSRRYKTNIASFGSGLSLIDRLRPVSFDWKDGGMADLGLVAEEVAEIEPLLTTTNAKGEVEGVKYDRVGVVLVNAVKEQQAQIEAQAETIRRQQDRIDALVRLVCTSESKAAICREK